MARIQLANAVAADFDRIRAHLDAHESDSADKRVKQLESAIAVLAHSPNIGRPREDGVRELVIGSGQRGYLALYIFVQALDVVVVLSLRHQREDRYATW